jgi:hypothetical protein
VHASFPPQVAANFGLPESDFQRKDYPFADISFTGNAGFVNLNNATSRLTVHAKTPSVIRPEQWQKESVLSSG